MTNKTKKVAIVTGGTKGIGKAIVQQLATRDFNIALTSRDIGRAKKAAEEIRSKGCDAVGLRFNIEDVDHLNPLVKDTIDAFGRIDVLVNNAISQSSISPLNSLSEEQMGLVFTHNFTHTLLLTRSVYPYLKETRGNIINIGSVVVNRHLVGLPLYAIVKGAILQMTKVLAAEWGRDGIRVNAINPGFIRTEAFSDLGMPEDVIEKSYVFYKNYQPLGRVGRPEEIGNIAAYLASDDAEFVTGSIIDVDGGYSVQGVNLYENE